MATVSVEEVEYPVDDQGYVSWFDFSWRGLNRSMDPTISYVRGLEQPSCPPLGAGLDIGGDKRMWPHSATIRADHIPVFLDRYRAFHLLGKGLVDEPEGGLRPLTEDEIVWCEGVLSHPDLDHEAIERARRVEWTSIGSMVSHLAYISQLASEQQS